MKSIALLMALILNASTVLAAEKSVMLSVSGMHCELYPTMIKRSLEKS